MRYFRYLIVVLCVAALAYFYLYSRSFTSIADRWIENWRGSSGALPQSDDINGRANGAFVSLARNSDIWALAHSIRQVEDRFNHKYHYDWVFLNDDDFDEKFIELTSPLVSGKAKYGKVNPEHWSFPDFIDQEKAARVREEMGKKNVIYGDSISYRHMCRFESGFFFRHELMMEYELYWRVEPGITYHCDINYDVFKYMADNGKIYGFILSLFEIPETIATLWESTKKFMSLHPEYIAADNLMKFISDDDGETYNHCHFWSNFEVGNLTWFRSREYLDFFDHLDHDGGFFYERWGDAPVHSIATALMLNKNQFHYFDDIAYFHPPITHCPADNETWSKNNCICDQSESFDRRDPSCRSRYLEFGGQ